MARIKTFRKQNEILEAASRIFSEREFHHVLIDDVAAAAGVGKGTIYRYFETKEELFFATILYGFDGLYEILTTTLPEEQSPVRRLERIAREMLRFLWTRRYLTTLLQNDERRVASREEELQKRRDLLSRLVQECLLAGIERREFRGIDVRIGSELFRGMIRAASSYRREEDTLDELVESIVGIFVHGIAKESV